MTPNGIAIKVIREARGLSLRQLSSLTDRDHAFLSRIESGERGAGKDTIHRIATALDTEIEAITKGDAP